MDIYLPIAGISVSLLELLGLGALVGIISGMFGVGGGFVMTPLLIFMGIPPAVAVASQANQMVGTSLSGTLAYLQRGEVDMKMGFTLFLGGMAGTALGGFGMMVLRRTGDASAVINFLLILLLGSIGGFMLFESLSRNKNANTILKTGDWRLPPLPFISYFPESHLSMSLLVPTAVGFFSGLLVALLGVGGSFFLVPVMIYAFGMNPLLVNGTSFLTILLTTSFSTVLHAILNKTVDPVLALVLLLGSLLGTQLGTRMALRLPHEISRFIMGAMLSFIALTLAYQLMHEPEELFTLMNL